MEKRVELGWLNDFYGALLTEHRQTVMRLYCEEDLSLTEIAEGLGITRQGVHDAIRKSEAQLTGYEAKLGLLRRYRAIMDEVGRCREYLNGNDESAIINARGALDRIERIER